MRRRIVKEASGQAGLVAEPAYAPVQAQQA
jgi:hypothetical protein